MQNFPSEAQSAEKKKRQGMKLNTLWLIQIVKHSLLVTQTEARVAVMPILQRIVTFMDKTIKLVRSTYFEEN